MSPEEFRQIQEIFSEALRRPASERSSFIEQVCDGNAELQSKVEDFLDLHLSHNRFMEEPLAETLGLVHPADTGQPVLAPGAMLQERFLIVNILEDSRQSSVYLAKDIRLYGKLVIVKILRHAAEAQILSALSHPSVAGILESGLLGNGSLYVVVEHVAGRSLRAVLREGAIERSRALRIVRQLAATVAHAHELGVWHLDLKPENVVLSDEGTSEERANLLDFGLSRISGVESQEAGGSLGYMAPEQARGKPEAASDIYSLGIMLFEMLTGELPSTPQLKPRISSPLRLAIAKATATRPDDRYASCRDFITALDREPARLLGAGAIAAIASLCAIAAAVLFTGARRASTVSVRPITIAASAGRVHWVALSPDGEKLYYAAGSRFFEYMDLYAKDLRTGVTRALTTDGRFKLAMACSPDGKFICFFRDRGMDKLTLVTMPSSGGPEREVFTGYLWSPRWGANSSTVLVSYRAERGDWPHLRAFDIPSSSFWDLTSPPLAGRGDSFPALSPDGRTVAFVRSESRESSDIFLLPVDRRLRPSGTPRRLTSRRVRALDPHWTAGGGELIFASGPLNHYKLYRVPTDGNADPIEVSEAGPAVESPSIAAAPGKVALIVPDNQTQVWRLDLASPTGPVARNTSIVAAGGSEVEAAFAPDGRSIAFVSDLSGTQQIWIAGANGANPRQLTSEGAVDGVYPVWLPDSSGLIASVRAKAFGVRNFLFRFPMGQGSEIPALEGKAIRFSRDGKWLYFSSSRTGDIEIFKYSMDTREIRQVTRESRAAHGIESPDGKTLYFSMPEEERGLWQVSSAGGKPAPVLPNLARRTLFDIGPAGIYYVVREPRKAVLRLRRFNGKDSELYRIDGVPAYGLSLSPDQRTILYSQSTTDNSRVILLEGVR